MNLKPKFCISIIYEQLTTLLNFISSLKKLETRIYKNANVQTIFQKICLLTMLLFFLETKEFNFTCSRKYNNVNAI